MLYEFEKRAIITAVLPGLLAGLSTVTDVGIGTSAKSNAKKRTKSSRKGSDEASDIVTYSWIKKALNDALRRGGIYEARNLLYSLRGRKFTPPAFELALTQLINLDDLIWLADPFYVDADKHDTEFLKKYRNGDPDAMKRVVIWKDEDFYEEK